MIEAAEGIRLRSLGVWGMSWYSRDSEQRRLGVASESWVSSIMQHTP